MTAKKVSSIDDFFCDYCKDHNKKHKLKFLYAPPRHLSEDFNQLKKYKYQCTGCKRKVYASERF